MYKAKNISKIYTNGIVNVAALDSLSFEIEDKEVLAIVGPSGSGKTSLLNVLSTVDNISEGKIYYNDIRIDKLSQKAASKLRLDKFGFVFQRYNLMPTLNIYDNIVLPIAFSEKKCDDMFFNELMNVLGIQDQLSKMPYELSGGQQQRVAIARSLIGKPEVVFADEPTGNLDSKNGDKVFSLLLDCAKEFGQTVIYVTHDERLSKLANRIIHLKDGNIYE